MNLKIASCESLKLSERSPNDCIVFLVCFISRSTDHELKRRDVFKKRQPLPKTSKLTSMLRFVTFENIRSRKVCVGTTEDCLRIKFSSVFHSHTQSESLDYLSLVYEVDIMYCDHFSKTFASSGL